jgi:anti-sigma regulatory factor (Ser/Thr protein kinase)
MIDLTHTRAQMLAEIEASAEASTNRADTPLSPLFVEADEASVVVRGRTPDDLLPLLTAGLSSRFAPAVPKKRLFADLTYLLKKGVGNAYKWGNRKDPSKTITAEVIVTRLGAVVSIVDEGDGFDVEGILRLFYADRPYYMHGGSGLRHFHKTRSLISYAEGGRMLLIRFRPGGRE